jgi:hypothetical protein
MTKLAELKTENGEREKILAIIVIIMRFALRLPSSSPLSFSLIFLSAIAVAK